MPRLIPFIVLLVILGGCRRAPVAEGPDYSRQLAPGERPLRLVTDPGGLPDLTRAYAARDLLLDEAVAESVHWFNAPSSQRAFPIEGITHAQARASVEAMRELLAYTSSAEAFRDEVLAQFDIYESVGYDGDGTVLFTGYYAPIFPASRVPTRKFTAPLYRRPADLVTDPATGKPLGQRTASGAIRPYPTRGDIEEDDLLAGTELVWLEDPMSAYLVHINGSARLRMPDGEILHIGYAGKTDRPYGSLSRAMIDEGLIGKNEVSLSAIKRVYQRNPHAVENLMAVNESFVFFTEVDPDVWPAGSLGVRVTGLRSLATDKKVFPRGGLVLVDTDVAMFSGTREPFVQFMVDQDTGGAIKAPGRADIFMGVGRGAELRAGGQYSEGKMYYFFLKPEAMRSAGVGY